MTPRLRALALFSALAPAGACLLDGDFQRKPCRSDLDCAPEFACRVVESGKACVRASRANDAGCNSNVAWDPEIQPIFVGNCGRCHSDPPTTIIDGGAPAPGGFRLDRYADTPFDGGTIYGAKTMADSALARIALVAAPMPPKPLPMLSAAEQKLVSDWVCGGLKEVPSVGDGGGTGPDAGACIGPQNVTLTTLRSSIFNGRCGVCHAGAAAPQGLVLANDGGIHANIVNRASIEVPSLSRVKPNDPTGSYLMLKVIGQHTLVPGGSGTQMPQGGPALTSAEQAQIHDWICLGALND